MAFPAINHWVDWLLFGYNIVAANGTAMPKRGALNFLPPLTCVDNSTNSSTDIGVNLSQLNAQELSPLDLRFTEVANGTLPGFMPANLVTLDEEFTNTSLSRFTILSEGTPVTPTISGGAITFVNTAGQNTGLQQIAPLGQPQNNVSMHVLSVTSSAGNAYENIGRGWAKDSNNYVMAVWRRRQGTNGTASIQVKISGTSNFVGSITLSAAWTPPFDIGLGIVGNSVVFYQRPNGGVWTEITSYDITSAFNLKTSSLAGWNAVFWLATDNAQTCTAVFQAAKVGLGGGFGIRDICPVTTLAGAPALTGSVLSLTATLTDPTGAAYCAAMSYDLLAKTLTQTGVIMVSRGGAVQNDNAAHLVQDGTGGFYAFITSWGTPSPASSVNIYAKHETVLPLLTGVNVIGSMSQLSLPNIPSSGGTYDPFAFFANGVWTLAFTYGPNSANSSYPGLATSPDLTTWTAAGQDTTAFPFEGSRVSFLGGSTTLMFSTMQSSGYTLIRAYDTSMNWLGSITNFNFPENGSNPYPAHFTLIPYGEFVYWVTFDNSLVNSVSGTEGQFRVFRARRYGVNG